MFYFLSSYIQKTYNLFVFFTAGKFDHKNNNNTQDWNNAIEICPPSNVIFITEWRVPDVQLFLNPWVRNGIIWRSSYYIWFESSFWVDTISFIFAGLMFFRSFLKSIVSSDTFHLGSKNYETNTHIDRAGRFWCLYNRTWLFSKLPKFECGIYKKKKFSGNDINIKVQTNVF